MAQLPSAADADIKPVHDAPAADADKHIDVDIDVEEAPDVPVEDYDVETVERVYR